MNWLIFLFSATQIIIISNGMQGKKGKEAIHVTVETNSENHNNNVVGLDCEFVYGTVNGKENVRMLGRVSVVNVDGDKIYDKFVRPNGKVTNYATEFSGIRKENLEGKGAVSFTKAQENVKSLIKGKILAGHELDSDFKVLRIKHPPELIRDTAKFLPLRKGMVLKNQNTPSLKALADYHLGETIQEGEHDSVEDARIPVEIYLKFRDAWEGRKEGEVARIVEGFKKMELTNEDNDFTFKYNKILASYEMDEHGLMKNQKKIMQDYELNEKNLRELFDFYELTKQKLEIPTLEGTDIKAYLDKFRAFNDLMFAYENNEAAKNCEMNITGRPTNKVYVTPINEKYVEYEYFVDKWNEAYRKRGRLVAGEANGVIIQIDKTVKRIVAMFDMKNVAKLKNEQRLFVANNAASYKVLEKTFYQSEWNASLLHTVISPNAQNLTPLNEFLRERKNKWAEFMTKFDKNTFNQEQLEAIYSITNGANGNIPFILWGPPGTGKTSTIVEAIRQLINANHSNCILICSTANRTADMVANLLLEKGIVSSEELRRLYSPGKNVADRDRKLDKVVCIEKVNFMGEDDEQFVICDLTKIRIVVMTLTASAHLEDANIGADFFSHIFVDEAAQAMEAESLIPITRYLGKKSRLILAGDHKQLGPVITARFLKNYPNAYDSMINRLISGYSNIYNNDGRFSVKLIRNYRSHEKILEFPSNQFYDRQLIAANTVNRQSFVNWELLPKKGIPIIFHIVNGAYEQMEGNSSSFWNKKEMEIVQFYVNNLLRQRNLKKEDIGVISPYKLQGSERRVIIMTLTRSDSLGFLREDTRINTSLTRAQELLIVIASSQILRAMREGESWNTFYKFCLENGAVKREAVLPLPSMRNYNNNYNRSRMTRGRGRGRGGRWNN